MRVYWFAAMANPIQQGLKHQSVNKALTGIIEPQWLIQYNKDWNRTIRIEPEDSEEAAMANPIQQGLKLLRFPVPQWLIQ